MSRKPIGPYSRTTALSKIDGRSRAARLAKQTREGLIEHLGGNPSTTELALIERVAQLSIRIGAMDRKFAENGEQTEHDSRTYLAWTANLARLLRQLGMRGVPQRAPTLAEI